MPKKTTKIISLKQAREIKVPVVYGISALDSDHIVYVGKTTNLYKRLEKHHGENTNPALRQWRSKVGPFQLIILDENPKDINASEKKWIKTIGINNLFNMVHGGAQAWRHHDRKPWMASIGVHCPSSLLMHRVVPSNRSPEYDKAKKIRGEMNDHQRCCYELSLAKDIYSNNNPFLNVKIDRWLAQTSERIEKCLEKTL